MGKLLLYSISVIAILGIAIVILTIWSPFSRKIRREQFPNALRDLLIGMENGSFIRFDHKNTNTWFSFERLAGTDTNATLVLRIPRSEKTELADARLRDRFESQGFCYSEADGNPSLLAKVSISINDIWKKNSGARGAHAARIFLDEMGYPVDAGFRIGTVGKASDRLLAEEFSARV